MTLRRFLAFVFSFILAGMVLLPQARADEWNQMTKLKFNEPVEIPGVVLPAGAYWFVLQDNQTDRQIVQVFSNDRSKLYATLLTEPAQRLEPKMRTEIKFAERVDSQPEALLDWYYPGRLVGHEFVYPKKEERELTRDAKQDVLARPMNSAPNTAMPGA